MIAAVLLALLGLCSANMNNGGIPYSIGNPSGSGTYKTEFTDAYFDVYSEVRTRYSQVYWTLNDPVDLPADIVSQFKGKVMAITGYEADQVVRTDQGDVSFPIHHAYNHHYFAWLKSTGTEMYQLEKPILSPNPTKWGIRDTKPKTHDFPTNIVFKENPGGEYRKSYHGYPKGYAQLIYSPDQFVLEPMQIDIHNRDYNGTGYPPVWFLPKELANQTDPNSKLSPLIECPCTDRIGRVVQNQSSVLTTGVCSADISSAVDCFAAVKGIVPVSTTTTVSSATIPAGCSISPDAGGKGTYTAIFNTASQSQATCGNSEIPSTHLKGSTATSLVTLGVEVDVPHARVNITLVGPSDVWFGVGFHATVMADLPYAIIVDGKGSVTERQLADHGPGSLLTPSITVVSNSVVKGVRTVVVSRPLTGTVYTFPSSPSSVFFIAAVGSTVDLQYHKSHTGGEITLVPTDISSCICAPVSTTYLSYMNSSLMEYNVYCAPEPRSDMAAQHNPACKMQTYMGGTACCHHSWFLTDVEQEPLIPQAEDVYYLKFRFYYQEYVPATQTAPASHQQLHHWVFLIDANVNDYEEVKCADGTLCEGYIEAHLQARDMGIEDTPPTYSGITPLVITAHCHAPSCLRQELFNADTGDLLCKVEAQYGTGSEAFNEEGYVTLAPCLFGNEDGLYKPITLSPDTNLTAIKVFNNTYRHLGQMAQWTGLMVYQP